MALIRSIQSASAIDAFGIDSNKWLKIVNNATNNNVSFTIESYTDGVSVSFGSDSNAHPIAGIINVKGKSTLTLTDWNNGQQLAGIKNGIYTPLSSSGSPFNVTAYDYVAFMETASSGRSFTVA